MTCLLLSILSQLIAHVLDAITDAHKHSTGVRLHLLEVGSIALFFTAGYFLSLDIISFEFGLYLLLSVCIRFAIFNIAYNLAHTPRLPVDNVGSTSIIDKALLLIPSKYRLMLYAAALFGALLVIGILEEMLFLN